MLGGVLINNLQPITNSEPPSRALVLPLSFDFQFLQSLITTIQLLHLDILPFDHQDFTSICLVNAVVRQHQLAALRRAQPLP